MFKLFQELGKTSTTTAATANIPKKTFDEVKLVLPEIVNESDLIKQAAAWDELKTSNSITKFGSANLRTFPVSLSMLEQRTGITADAIFVDTNPNVNLDDFKYATLYVAGFSTIAGVSSLALLPPNIGATLCYLFALIPILFLAIGSTAPGLIADVIAVVKEKSNNDNESNSSIIDPIDRKARHEAAHFCCGYWCGLPVQSYTIQEDGICQVEFAVSRNTQYTSTEVAALAVTALSGLVGEVMKYKNAVGATQDLLVLENVFRKSSEFIGSASQQDLTRWGALTAALLLKQNYDKYEQIVEAFRKQVSIEECIAILES